MIRFLLDQGLPRSTVDALAALGIAAEHVGPLGMARASDQDILDAAVDRGAVVVTLDADFHSLLATAKAVTPSIVRIRIEGLKGDDVADIVRGLVTTIESELKSGAAVSVTERGVRIRMLPLV